MRIRIHLDKSVEENAGIYFDRAKKLKKKIEGINTAMKHYQGKLSSLEEKEEKPKQVVKKEAVKREWYEKFRWFFSSEGFLCIGGRDSTTNEIIIKKHTEPDDLVFHTDMAGSPFFVVKAEGRKIGEQTIKETASAISSYSRAWSLGLGRTDVFYVKPEQVSKRAKAGEFLAKGSFMIHGKTTYVDGEMRIAVGIKDGKVIGGPVDAVASQAERYAIISQGKEKPSSVAKSLKATFHADIDEIMKFLPSGSCRIEKLVPA